MTDVLDGTYWDKRHRESNTPWDIGGSSPALKLFYATSKQVSGRVLVPGAGHAHEVVSLLDAGCTDITVCDISLSAVEGIRLVLGDRPGVTYITGDFFEVTDTFDLIVEQTFFCALHPDLREAYVQKMASLLAENGVLAGLLFASHFTFEGPPFGGTKEEYSQLFTKFLHIYKMEMCMHSIPARQGNELFFICKKKM